MMPFEYICGCMGMGLSGLRTKVTSGGSEKLISMTQAESIYAVTHRWGMRD